MDALSSFTSSCVVSAASGAIISPAWACPAAADDSTSRRTWACAASLDCKAAASCASKSLCFVVCSFRDWSSYWVKNRMQHVMTNSLKCLALLLEIECLPLELIAHRCHLGPLNKDDKRNVTSASYQDILCGFVLC